MVQNRSKNGKKSLLPFKCSYLKIKNEHIDNYLKLFTQLDVKQLMIFGCTVVAASDLKNCTMVNCEISTYSSSNNLGWERELSLLLFTCFFSVSV